MTAQEAHFIAASRRLRFLAALDPATVYAAHYISDLRRPKVSSQHATVDGAGARRMVDRSTDPRRLVFVPVAGGPEVALPTT